MPRLLRSSVVVLAALAISGWAVAPASAVAVRPAAGVASPPKPPPTPQAQLATINAALDSYDAKLASDLVDIQASRHTVAQAVTATAQAGARIQQIQARSGAITKELRRRAVEAYVGTVDTDDPLAQLVGGNGLRGAVGSRRVGAEFSAQSDASLMQQLKGQQADLRVQRTQLAKLRQAAQARTLQLAAEVKAVAQA
ncbi:MAG TPA: hypothetical protein VGM93_09885, partial [Acidimicrobiales bacterium]